MKFKKSTSIFLISIATTISRVFGLVREMIFAFLLGATGFSDAFIVAFRIPNLLRDLFAEGALSTAFIPTFTKYLVKKGKKEAFRLANHVINFLFLFIALLIILGYLFTPDIVGLIAKDYTVNPAKMHLFSLTVFMTRILMPFLLFVSIAAVFMGILNSHGKFFISALAPALFNITINSFGILIFIYMPEDINKVIIWSAGALAGGVIQLLIQIPSAYKLGFRYRFSVDWKFKNEGLRRIIKLMMPAVIGLAAVQFNIIYNTNLAIKLAEGTATCLNYAFRLIWFPIGIFGVAIATVNTAVVSRDIAKKNFNLLKDNVAYSLKMNSFLNIPSMVFLFVLGTPVIRLLFEHGQFTPDKTEYTYYALQFYIIALFFYSGNKILAPVFYAMKKSFIPVIASVCAVGVNIFVATNTYKVIGIKGLALGVSSASFVNFAILMVMFIYYHGLIKGKNISNALFKHIIASTGMGLVGYYVYRNFINSGYLLSIILPVIISGVAYLLFSYILKVRELHEFLGIFKRKFKK